MNETFLRLRDRLLRSLLLRIAARSLLRYRLMVNRLLRGLISLLLSMLRRLRHLLVRHRLLYGLRMLGRLLILRGRLLYFRQRREDRLARRIIN